MSSLDRGLRALEEDGLLIRTRTSINPTNHQRFAGPRIIYLNRFATPETKAKALPEASFREAIENAATEDSP